MTLAGKFLEIYCLLKISPLTINYPPPPSSPSPSPHPPSTPPLSSSPPNLCLSPSFFSLVNKTPCFHPIYCPSTKIQSSPPPPPGMLHTLHAYRAHSHKGISSQRRGLRRCWAAARSTCCIFPSYRHFPSIHRV